MSSLIDDLNALLTLERGILEATATLVDELDSTDPDIADTARGVVETASWSCQGLTHRVRQLGGTPTIEVPELAQDMDDLPDDKAKIQFVCKQQRHSRELAKQILKRDDVDADTQGFLDDMLGELVDSVNWCKSTLDQWKVDI